MGNNRSSTSSSSATSSYSQYTHSIPNKNFNDKNTRQFWKTSISARESFDNSPQQKEETKTRLRNRSLVLFQQPKLNKGGGNNNWWPLKRIKNRSIEKKNSYGVPPPPSMLFDCEINGEEEEIQSLENRPLIDLTVTSSENNSPCSSLPPNQPTTMDDSNTTTTTSTTTTTTFISFRPQRCHFLENFVENKNNNNSEFNKHQRRAKSFRHFPSTKTCNNSRRSTR
uniref:Uncharacterized protein n=1 Tax=Meloidogyne incognita TaxID=6306 RepID=A0A914M3G6_MELIC